MDDEFIIAKESDFPHSRAAFIAGMSSLANLFCIVLIHVDIGPFYVFPSLQDSDFVLISHKSGKNWPGSISI